MRWDDMNMSQKSEAIGLMVRNGVTDIGTMKQMWDDMDGRKKQKPSYGEWVKGVNPQFMGPDYNLRAAYNELPFETMEAWRKDPNTNHLPDTYKLPNHPTFSDESKYSQGPVIGGSWHYKPISQGEYLPEEILVGGINGVEPNPMYRSFDDGGSSNIPPERFFGIAAPEVTENTLYQPSYGTLLPEINVKAKGDPRKINNDYYKAHAVERAGFEDRVAEREEQGWVPQTMLGLASLPLDVEGVVGLQLLYEQLPKWVLNVPKNSNRYYRIVDKRAIDDYISSEKIRSAQAAKEAGVDTEGPKQAGRFLLKKNHDYNMFSKGEPWQGGLATRDKNKPYILVSKENTGKTVWEQSNVDFRHKGHAGIYRPRYEGDLDATPSIYFDYYKPRLIGYTKHSFAEGGSIDDPPVLKQSEAPFRHHDKKKEERLKRLYSISANIMNFGKEFSGEDSMGWEDPFDGEWTGINQNEYSTPYRIANNGVAQATFLMPRKQQAEIFRRAGYTEHPNDYGLVRKAVVKDGRDIPVWQSKPDLAKRDDLIYLGYTLDEDSEAQKYLEDPGVMPTAYYVDSKTGNAFFKGWDLNDYDVSNGNHRQYNFIQRLGANIINKIGSPVVVTTGFQPTEVYYLPPEIKEEMYNQHHLIPTLELIAPEDFSSYDEYKSVKNKLPKWSLPEVRIGLE